MISLYNQNRYLYLDSPENELTKIFSIQNINGTEFISDVFEYRLTLHSNESNIDFSKILGQSLTVTIKQDYGEKEKRHVNGIVSKIAHSNFDKNETTYIAITKPWLWRLSLSSDCRIFQNKTVLDIIKQVFTDFGFSKFRDDTKGTYKEREFCVIYHEDYLTFVSRLLQEEGIIYYFEHKINEHTLVLTDAPSRSFLTCPGLDKGVRVKYSENPRDGLIENCNYEQQLIPNKYTANDYFFENPNTSLLTKINSKEKGNFEIYEYGQFCKTPELEKHDQIEQISTKRIEAYESQMSILKGQSYCRGFIAGYKFDLLKHSRKNINVAYIISKLTLNASSQKHFNSEQDSQTIEYTNEFEAFPESIPFRPLLTIPKPKITGTHTGVVVGKPGEEIWPDKYGRVKVQFHWDREGTFDDSSSCWIRVAQTWAGKKWGSMFIPRVGTEVIITFIDGDPDQPVIIGTLFNASQVVPYNLPADKNITTIKTRSTKNGSSGNELRFNDTLGNEELFIHAQKDQNNVVENDLTTTVKSNLTQTVEKNRTKTIKGDETNSIEGNKTDSVKKDESITITGERKKRIEKDELIDVMGNSTTNIVQDANTRIKGNQLNTVESDRHLVIKGDQKDKIEGNKHIKVNSDLLEEIDGALSTKSNKASQKMNTTYALEAGTEIHIKAGTKLVIEAGTEITIKSGQNFIKFDATGVSIVGAPMAKVNSGGMASNGIGCNPSKPSQAEEAK